MPNEHPQQSEVDSILRSAVVFSILWLMGLGSCLAVIKAMKARKMIRLSGDQITGMGKVWWCFVVGGAGIFFWVFVITMMIVRNQ